MIVSFFALDKRIVEKQEKAPTSHQCNDPNSILPVKRSLNSNIKTVVIPSCQGGEAASRNESKRDNPETSNAFGQIDLPPTDALSCGQTPAWNPINQSHFRSEHSCSSCPSSNSFTKLGQGTMRSWSNLCRSRQNFLKSSTCSKTCFFRNWAKQFRLQLPPHRF